MALPIAKCQALLNQHGFPCGAADGDPGPKTSAAVRRLQAAYAGGVAGGKLLAIDGQLGPLSAAAIAGLPHLSPHFLVHEVRSKGDGTCYVRRELLLALEALRARFGHRPIALLSGYRDPFHNKKVGGAKYSMHVEGLAADLAALLPMQPVLMSRLFSGVGTKGSGVRHVDLRHLSANNRTKGVTVDRPARWAY